MLLSLQTMDNTTGYQEDISKKGKKRPWFDADPPGEPPVTGITRLTIGNRPELAPRSSKAKLPTWGQQEKLTTEGEKLIKEQGQPLTSATLF